ncbi:MAG: DPP IV N-terminal domain-containing protein [Gemmatimonadales bacterium]|nr:DPP IV N-terminal domain-containing protein [Gemmatimonadales bacterium]
MPTKILATLSSTLMATTLAAAQPQMPAATYSRAESMMPTGTAGHLVLRDKIVPQWIAGSDRFWYRVTTERGPQFIYVDPARRIRRPAFDHVKLAAALAAAADTTLNPDSLPFPSLRWIEEGRRTAVEVEVRRANWRCDLATYQCGPGTPVAAPAFGPDERPSPDGKWALYLDRHNLWVRNVQSGERRALTTDGVDRHEYGGYLGSSTEWVTRVRTGAPAPPLALWSADSKRILAQRIDQRGVADLHLIQTVHPGGVRPKLWSFPYPIAGDSLSRGTWWIFEVESGRAVAADAPPMTVPMVPLIEFGEAWWGDSTGGTAYYVERERGARAWFLKAIDAATGRTRTVAEERGQMMVEPAASVGNPPLLRVLPGGKEVIWYSQRDGWSHLYLVDAETGRIKNQITKGEWVVREIIKADVKTRRLWFTAAGREPGRDPYLMHLYSIGFDGTGLTLLTPEDLQHQIMLGAGGDWVIDRMSRADRAPITVARSLDGKSVVPLEQADVSRLLATGWRWPEPFVAKAADGVTDVYGILYFPSNFDSTRRYPIIEEIYPGPQRINVPKGFFVGTEDQSHAELGTIGVRIDGRGTPLRSKAFHTYAYGRLETAGGLEDHVAALRQIARTRPYLDLDRVGIYGSSGGGFASVRAMLAYPDFYKVAVSASGNHDNRGYLPIWGETYQSYPLDDGWLKTANWTLAANLKGKLLLAYGELDDNVAPAQTFQLIDALTRANRDYDLLVATNGSHYMAANTYYRRRRWDYFVEHLLGMKPPANYLITAPTEYPHSGTAPSPERPR